MAKAAAEFYKGISEGIQNAIKRVTPFRAMATQVSDGKVQIHELGADAPLDEPFARLEGFDVQAGDEVAVIMLGDKPFVLGTVQRTAGTGKELSEPLTLNLEDNQAFLVQKPDGTGIFLVDSLSPSGVSFLNGIPVTGYGVDQTQKWTINAAGNATFGVVTASNFNSPQFYQIQGWSPTVASTTSNTTYSEVRELTFTLPVGTWSLFIIAVGSFKTNGSYVDYRLNVNGSALGVLNIIANNYWATGSLMGASHNKSGAQSVKLEYKAYSAGNTAEARNHAITAIAVRTA